MNPIKIRDLETGDVLIRHGAVAEELLANPEPERDEDGELVLDGDGQPVSSGYHRYVRHGREPRDWTHPKGVAGQTVAGQVVAANQSKPAPRRRGARQSKEQTNGET